MLGRDLPTTGLSKISKERRKRSSLPVGTHAESIERFFFIEGQASLRSYDLAPRPPHSPFLVNKLDREGTC